MRHWTGFLQPFPYSPDGPAQAMEALSTPTAASPPFGFGIVAVAARKAIEPGKLSCPDSAGMRDCPGDVVPSRHAPLAKSLTLDSPL
jgi:hypothetical protein